MAARKKQKPEKRPAEPRHGVWGILCFALGILVLISVVSRLFGRPEILGPVFGVQLSSGLLTLFGPIPSLVVPLAMVASGVRQIRGN